MDHVQPWFRSLNAPLRTMTCTVSLLKQINLISTTMHSRPTRNRPNFFDLSVFRITYSVVRNSGVLSHFCSVGFAAYVVWQFEMLKCHRFDVQQKCQILQAPEMTSLWKMDMSGNLKKIWCFNEVCINVVCRFMQSVWEANARFPCRRSI